MCLPCPLGHTLYGGVLWGCSPHVAPVVLVKVAGVQGEPGVLLRAAALQGHLRALCLSLQMRYELVTAVTNWTRYCSLCVGATKKNASCESGDRSSSGQYL